MDPYGIWPWIPLRLIWFQAISQLEGNGSWLPMIATMTPCSMAIVMGFVEGFQDLRLFLTALKNDVVDAEKKLMWLEDCPRCCELRQRLCFIYWHDDFPRTDMYLSLLKTIIQVPRPCHILGNSQRSIPDEDIM